MEPPLPCSTTTRQTALQLPLRPTCLGGSDPAVAGPGAEVSWCLLPQPHRFEGLRVIPEVLDGEDPAVTHRIDAG
jgi:hypothetical protein